MKLTPPVLNFKTPEKYWDDAKEGDVCISPGYEVTEERINAYAVLTGDYTPVHIDEDYAKTTPFGDSRVQMITGSEKRAREPGSLKCSPPRKPHKT